MASLVFSAASACSTRRSGLALLLFLFIASLLTASPHKVWAQGPPINTETAIITGLEGAAVRNFVQVIRKSGALSGGQEGRLSIISVPFIIPYEVRTNRFLLVGVIPYLDKELEITGGTPQKLSTSGLGDLRVLGVVNVFQRDALEGTTRATVIGGMKFPTGEDDEPGIPKTLQVGSGSVDYAVGSVGTWVQGRVGVNVDLIYTLATEKDDFKFGNTLKYDLAFGFRLLPVIYEVFPSPQLNLYLELNGLYAKQNKIQGAEVPDSGGNTLFLSPGIQFIPGRAFLVEAAVQVPLLEDLRGTQLETDLLFTLGFRWLIL